VAGFLIPYGIKRAFGYTLPLPERRPAPDQARLQALRLRIDRAEVAVRGLTRADIAALASAPRDKDKSWAWNGDSAFWFADTGSYKPTIEEQWALEELYGRMRAAVASVVIGPDVPEDNVDHMLERAAGGQVWAAVARIWNACCASLLEDRLDSRLRSDLEAQWRRVVGRQMGVAEIK
jgi:hypothetical protein